MNFSTKISRVKFEPVPCRQTCDGNRRVTLRYFYLVRASFMWLSLKDCFESASLIGRCKENTIFPRASTPYRRCDLKYLLAGAADIVPTFDYFTRKWSENLSCEFQKESPLGNYCLFAPPMQNLLSMMRAFCNAIYIAKKYLPRIILVAGHFYVIIMQLFWPSNWFLS